MTIAKLFALHADAKKKMAIEKLFPLRTKRKRKEYKCKALCVSPKQSKWQSENKRPVTSI